MQFVKVLYTWDTKIIFPCRINKILTTCHKNGQVYNAWTDYLFVVKHCNTVTHLTSWPVLTMKERSHVTHKCGQCTLQQFTLGLKYQNHLSSRILKFTQIFQHQTHMPHLEFKAQFLVITATTNFALLHTGLFSSSLVFIAYTWIIDKVTYRKCIYKQFQDYV